ncbi:MAG TPA: hypothetical protein PK971_09900 [Saprospiraceae bacterium]|nr:hypothetical protein [Saprospiraceae bacterium]HND88633.1 hypothetical protein [Saprospiraceae bacterium]
MKKLLLFLVVAGLLAAAYGYYLWNKPHENMAKATAAFTLSAEQLLGDYLADENAANAKYLGKIVAVTGKVKETTAEDGVVKVMLDAGNENFGVYCTLDSAYQHPRKDFPAGSPITLKGSCDGLNLDVQLSRCVEQQ